MAKDIKKPASPSGPQAQVLHDPIVLWWEKWRKTVISTFVGIVVIFLAINIYGRFQRSAEAKESEKIALVVGASSIDDATSQANQLDSGASRRTGQLAAFQKAVMGFDGDIIENGEELSKAIEIGEQVSGAGTLWSELLLKGFEAVGGPSSDAPLAKVKQTVADKQLSAGLAPPKTDGAPTVQLTIALDGGKTIDLKFAIFEGQAPELSKAFLGEVAKGAFDLLYLYSGSAGGGSLLRFGDARASSEYESAYLPNRTNWGNGPNLHPIAWNPSTISAEAGRLVAWVDNATGMASARELAFFDEKLESTASVGNMAHVVFGQLLLSQDEEISAKLADLSTQVKATDEEAFRPYIVRAVLLQDPEKEG